MANFEDDDVSMGGQQILQSAVERESEDNPLSQVLRKRKSAWNASGIWEHCEITVKSNNGKIEKIKCNHCNKEYAFGSTTTFSVHLNIKHNIVVEKQSSQNVNMSKLKNNNSYNSSFNSSNDSVRSSLFNELPVSRESTPIDPIKADKLNKSSAGVITRTLLLFIITSCLPFRIVENFFFKKLINLLCSSYVIPNRRTLSTTILNDTYESIISQIKNKLKDAETISATTDLWTSNQNLPYIGVTIHFIDGKFNYKNYTICIQHLPGSHNSDNLHETLSKIFEEWEIENLVKFVVTDNGKDICKAIKKRSYVVHLRCMGHLLNLIVRKVVQKKKNDLPDFLSQFEDEENEQEDEIANSFLNDDELEILSSFQELIKKCKKIAIIFNSSNLAADVLRKLQETNNEEIHSIPVDVCTRWNSTFKMMERINNQVNLINEALCDRSLNKKFRQYVLNETEIKNLASAVDILHCFDYATTLLSGSTYNTISVCIPIIYMISQNLEEQNTNSNFATVLKKELLYSLDFYCDKYQLKHNKVYLAATFLDPRFKNFSVLPELPRKEALKNSKKFIKEYLSLNHANLESLQATESNSPVKKKYKFFDFETTEINQKRGNPLDIEFNEYTKLAVDETTSANFWFKNKNKFPLLYAAAKHFLCVPATSVPSENLFSHAGYNVWDRRNKLHPNTVKKTMIIYENQELIIN